MPRSRQINTPPSEERLTEEQKCGARNATNGKQCGQGKGAGTSHPGYGYCLHHGGNTEAGSKSAMREMGLDLITQYKAEHQRFGGNRHDPSIATLTPEQALLEEVRRSAAMVRFLEERIGTWTLASGVTEDTLKKWESIKSKDGVNLTTLRRQTKEFLESLDPENEDSPYHLPALADVNQNTGITSFTDAQMWLTLYREERGHLVRTSKLCIDAGVAQRLVSIAEDQGRILASALRLVLHALNLTPDQEALVPRVVPPILRAVATDSPLPDLPALLSSTTATN